MIRMHTLISLLALSGVTACFEPTYHQGIACSEIGRCPEGMVCEPMSNICYVTIPPCTGDPCGEHGACTERQEPGGDGYTCACEPGFVFDSVTCADIDECDGAEDPCAPSGTCVNGNNEYTCDCDEGYADNGTTCELVVHGIVGQGTAIDPRRWEDGSFATSCDAYLNPALPYLYQGATGDGIYAIQPAAGSAPRTVACDMTTDGGGFTRMVFWDRQSDPVTHTLASLLGQLVDEIAEIGDPTISTMTALIEGPGDVQWADVNATWDALAYRRDIDIPNRGDLRLDIHYYGYSMEDSGTWAYVSLADVVQGQDVLCRSDADTGVNYTAAERALIPYACPLGIGGSESFTWDSVEERSLGAPITAFHLRSLHADSNVDRSYLYRLIVWIR